MAAIFRNIANGFRYWKGYTIEILGTKGTNKEENKQISPSSQITRSTARINESVKILRAQIKKTSTHSTIRKKWVHPPTTTTAAATLKKKRWEREICYAICWMITLFCINHIQKRRAAGRSLTMSITCSIFAVDFQSPEFRWNNAKVKEEWTWKEQQKHVERWPTWAALDADVVCRCCEICWWAGIGGFSGCLQVNREINCGRHTRSLCRIHAVESFSVRFFPLSPCNSLLLHLFVVRLVFGWSGIHQRWKTSEFVGSLWAKPHRKWQRDLKLPATTK